jgi:threonine dehydrogenase-like Zn-dependent dehydrogenase
LKVLQYAISPFHSLTHAYLHSRSFDPSALIIVSEPTTLRRQTATKQGATHVLDSTSTSIPERVLELTGGVGVDIAFDAAGVQVTMDAAIASVRPRGTVVNVAIWEKPAIININLLVMKEIFVTGWFRHFLMSAIGQLTSVRDCGLRQSAP